MSDLDAKVIDFVRKVTGAMGLDLEVAVEETPDNIRLNLSGENADALLRRKGEALDALQVIVNTAFRRDARGDRHYVVDALGFRKGKDAELRQKRHRATGNQHLRIGFQHVPLIAPFGVFLRDEAPGLLAYFEEAVLVRCRAIGVDAPGGEAWHAS